MASFSPMVWRKRFGYLALDDDMTDRDGYIVLEGYSGSCDGVSGWISDFLGSKFSDFIMVYSWTPSSQHPVQ
jgi:hypothetical protein